MILRALLLAAGLGAFAAGTQAGVASLQYCDRPSALTAREQDRLLRFAAAARAELEDAGGRVAIVARSGLDLSRFGERYSHAGVSLKANPNAPWSVRQLYYACDERRPRLYDQGLAGFLFGTEDPSTGFLSITLLPGPEAQRLEEAALDRALALRLLGSAYSANAHAWSLRYQNCNQWVAELLAAAWGGLGDGQDLRARAQHWLAGAGYAPRPIDVGSHLLMIAGLFIPWIHTDDHPEDDRFALRLRVSMPASIDDFVRRHAPGAARIELCHDEQRIVVRRGWTPIADGCTPGPGDNVLSLE